MTRQPIQAGDYGKHDVAATPEKVEEKDVCQTATSQTPDQTDGRKTLALWSH